MSVRVKICGVTRPEDAAAAAALGAWAVGMIFVPGTPRFLSADKAAAVAAAVPDGVLKVGVFLDAPQDDVLKTARALSLDLIQLHGAEDERTVSALGAERCVKALFLETEQGVRDACFSPAAFLLADRRRGSGDSPEKSWPLAALLAKQRERVLLAGGLTPENVQEALRAVSPWGVDVSSGVESAVGIKDHGKMEIFFAAVEAARRAGLNSA